ncbi:major facilitator superfamily-domain-containing protein [Parachaetomium inaequale]|uniref:Major facilitator superfamily-domain-containing protein n=1 Tax=Parachaetomium inaequale TaxID=2588326 RepID=A0AAN6SMD2_9PEZI|nr:major facilitator superfamily-domain-containing protein [Parachaetomium inaequale]
MEEGSTQQPSEPNSALHGLRLWVVIGGMMLGVYLVGLDMTIVSTIVPPLTDYFGSINDVSWYGAAYTLAVCVFIPPVGKIYTIFRIKHVYLAFLAVFEAGSIICAASTSSYSFIIGRAVTGIGSAGLLSGALLTIIAACIPSIRPVVTAIAMSMISVGSITGPLIAGALTDRVTWRWCFWIFLPLGGAITATTLPIAVPEQSAKPPLREACAGLHKKLDVGGFILFASLTTMLLLSLTWGGGRFRWSSPTIIGLLCGTAALVALFAFWIRRMGNNALMPLSSLRRRAVVVGSLIMFFQGGATQMIPYFLPFWFQAIRGDSPVDSAVHILPSLVSNIVALIAFGALVRRFHYIPPWAIAGSALASVGSGLFSTFTPETTTGQWIGYQIITTLGRGMAFQVPVVSVQEEVPAEEVATGLAIVNLFMNLGSAVAVSLGQTIFQSYLPRLLAQYAPGVDAGSVINAGATNIRGLVSSEELPGLLVAYNKALALMFYLPAACSALACLVGAGLGWGKLSGAEDINGRENGARSEKEKESSGGSDV